MTSTTVQARRRPTPNPSPLAAPHRRVHRARPIGWLLVAAIVVLAVLALGWGDYPLSPPHVFSALTGHDGFASVVVVQWRLPRVLAALAFGAALATSGALFQSLTRNPLGSPDVIGFTTGAYTGVLVATLVLGQSMGSAAAGALIGGFATAAAVYLLAYRRGIQGFRLIVVGIAVTAALSSINRWLLLSAPTEAAMGASIWGAGSLSLVDWAHAGPALVALALLTPAVIFLARPMRQLELGDDAAAAHGVRVEPTRLAIIAVAVALIAIVTAVAGPIAFVALAAPQVAARISRSAGLPLVTSALLGAALLLIADLVAQHLLPGSIPVGLITLVFGGCYLLSVLWREAQRRG